MSVTFFTPYFLDASAAVKLVVTEKGSDRLLGVFHPTGSFYITSFCLFEALGVLKRKMLKKNLLFEQYLKACWLLLEYQRSRRLRVDALEMSSHETFQRSAEFARRHSLDLSDALQLVGLKYGRFSHYAEESAPVLITADGALEKAAAAEGLEVWNCETSENPRKNRT